jgi:hypothetical protein
MEEIRMPSMGSTAKLSKYSNEGLIFYMDSAEILVRPKDMKVYSDETP